MLKRAVAALAVAASLAVPAAAADGPKISLGYAFLRYLEEGGGDAPLGVYLSGWGAGRGTFELDIARHRDTDGGAALNTFTVLGGPRAGFGGRSSHPYAHALGGLRHDRFAGGSNTSYGGAAGLGIDIGPGGGAGTRLRLGADFEVFFEEGESLKALRLTAGFTF
ncbi:MAG TPA: hypothetical protein VLI67_06115 [Vicinamibacteria bacterium]|nr:hypothetical protein [Vicinamibacteria bacterium]